MTAHDQEEQELRIELMTAQLEQIRFQVEQARREADTHHERSEQLAREGRRRFWIQIIVTSIVTSIAGVTAAVALILHLLGRV